MRSWILGGQIVLACHLGCPGAAPKRGAGRPLIDALKLFAGQRAHARNFMYSFVLRVGLVAQLVEQRIENPRVGGSIPPQATKYDASALERVLGRCCFWIKGLPK